MLFLNCKANGSSGTLVHVKKEAIRKMSYFNFQGKKPLYQNNFKHIAFFFTFFRVIDVISYCNSTKFLMGA